MATWAILIHIAMNAGQIVHFAWPVLHKTEKNSSLRLITLTLRIMAKAGGKPVLSQGANAPGPPGTGLVPSIKIVAPEFIQLMGLPPC